MANGNEVEFRGRGMGCDGEDYLRVSFMRSGRRRDEIIAVRDLQSAPALRSIGILTPTSKNAFIADAEVT